MKVKFGSRDVPPEEKFQRVRDLFTSVAGKYDLMNDLMSGGIHRFWKGVLIDCIAPTSQMTLIDVAGGTGDIAIRFIKAGGGKATVVDPNPSMIMQGKSKCTSQAIEWQVGRGEELEFESNSFDTYTISFGLRNTSLIDKVIKEAFRVLKPGGRFFCLEFSHVAIPIVKRAYDLYSFNILPWLGEKIAQDREAYLYLAESIRSFPTQEVLLQIIKEQGFIDTSYQNLSLGVAAIHFGTKPL